MNGAELFVRELQQREVPFIATLCGHGLDPLGEACRKAGLSLVDVRNEQTAGYMAEVTGRLTRRVGVCAVSSGVAHVNALTGVTNAHFDGAPMLLVTGSGPTQTMGLGHFQDLDQVALADPICKYARVVDRAERIPQYVHEAFAAATAGRPGPVHLTVPLDVLAAEVDMLRIPSAGPSSSLPAPGDPDRISEAVSLLSGAKRPLLIAGSGAYYAEAEEALAAFAGAFAIPVVVPIWDRGAVPRPLGEFMGVVGAASGGPRLLEDADLILMVGARCDYRVGYLQPPAVREDARIVHIDADPLELGRGGGAHLPIFGSSRTVLNQLAGAAGDRNLPPFASWLAEAQSRRDAFRQRVLNTPRPAGGDIFGLDIVRAIGSVLTDDTILLIDGGNIGQWAHQVLCDRYPGHWLTCGASGVIGYGLAGAMAARKLYPDRPILLLSGDGSLTFTVAEFETAARQGLGFVVLLADDRAWGIVLSGHEKKYGGGIASELGPIRFDDMARAFGAHGARIERPDGIVPAIREGFGADRPTLIHLPVARSSPADTNGAD